MTPQKPALLSDPLHRSLIDAIPLPLFVVEEDLQVIDFNEAAAKVLGLVRGAAVKRRAGEILQCLNSGGAFDGCGATEHCRRCIVRDSVNQAFLGRKVTRRSVKMDLNAHGTKSEGVFLVSASPLLYPTEKRVLLILEETGEAGGFRPLIPICAGCKKIRDKNTWHEVETYFRSRMGVSFTHSLCPHCARRYYPECFDEDGKEVGGA